MASKKSTNCPVSAGDGPVLRVLTAPRAGLASGPSDFAMNRHQYGGLVVGRFDDVVLEPGAALGEQSIGEHFSRPFDG
jgi:hypothetical protein